MKFKIPRKKNIKLINEFFIKKGLKYLVFQSKLSQKNSANDMIKKDPYLPEVKEVVAIQ